MNFYTMSPVRFAYQAQVGRVSSPAPGLQKVTVSKDSVHFGRAPHPQPPVDLPTPPENTNALQEQHVYRLRRSHDPEALQQQIEIHGNGFGRTVYSISDDPVAGGRRDVRTYFLYQNNTHVGEIYRAHNGPWLAYKLHDQDAPISLIPQSLTR